MQLPKRNLNEKSGSRASFKQWNRPWVSFLAARPGNSNSCYHSYLFTYFGHGTDYLKGHLLENVRELSTKEIVIELLRPGLYALVGAFFVLSGYLVAGCAGRAKHAGDFLWCRVLRIVPAL